MPVRLKKLRKALAAYGAYENSSRGKGGHTAFFLDVGDGRVEMFPLPNKKEVLDSYVRSVRRKFGLTPEDGVSDEEWNSHF